MLVLLLLLHDTSQNLWWTPRRMEGGRNRETPIFEVVPRSAPNKICQVHFCLHLKPDIWHSHPRDLRWEEMHEF